MNNEQPTQTALANALGLARSRITAMKKQGMPTHSIDAAHAWRKSRQNIARRKPMPRPSAPSRPPAEQPAKVTAMLDAASAALDAGQCIDALVPMLRAAMAAVPPAQRDDVGLPLSVMLRLVAHVLDTLPPREENPLDDDGLPLWCNGAEMTHEEAQFCGEIWYEIAAGEILL